MSEQFDQISKSVSEILTPNVGKEIRFSHNGLATPPARAVRSLFGLFGQLNVPPGTWAVCYIPNKPPTVLEPGTHWLSGLDGAATLVQFVDACRRNHKMEPVVGISLDGWSVALQVVLFYQVNDPVRVAQAMDPFGTLESIAQAAILAQIETMPHEALLGTIDTPLLPREPTDREDEAGDLSDDQVQSDGGASGINGKPHHQEGELGKEKREARGLDVVESGLLERLNNRPGLEGLLVADVVVIDRAGDERLVDILQGEALTRLQAIQGRKTEAAQGELEKMRLEMQVQTAQAARAVSIIQAETQAQLASIQEQMCLLDARTEAEVQEIRQVQEAREADRKRIAEEWRTAKELDMKSMEYQHAETIAVIQGTTEITSEAAKNGLFNSLQGHSHQLEIESDGSTDVVGAGIQALRGFREKITPPKTYFLPKPTGQSTGLQLRVETESLRLDRFEYAEHELILRHGEISGARVWFTAVAPSPLVGVRLEFKCPEGYPLSPPQVEILCSEDRREYPAESWDAGWYLVDLVSEIIVSLLSEHHE